MKKYYSFDKNLNLKESHFLHLTGVKKKVDNYLIAKYINIGYYLIIPLIFGILGGFFLDKILKTEKIFFIICFSFGIIGTFYNLIKIYLDERKNS